MTVKSSIQVAITPPNFQHLAINFRGTTPLVINRFSAKAMESIRIRQLQTMLPRRS
jgi:hypothetical protein